jgi:RNA polymerase sigma-70 factor (ECF subfamily)
MQMPADDTIAEFQRRIAVYEDEEAYKQLFFLLFEPLRQFAHSFVKSKETAEDIVSDIFIEIWARRFELDQIHDLKAYLFVCVRNKCVKKQRHQKQMLSLDEVPVELSSQYANPDELTISHDLHLRIHEAIEQLPPRSKMIFKLAKEEKMKYKEIATLMSISVKTIDAQLSSAIKRIASAIRFASRSKS